ncbi:MULTISPECIES: hypothetical protein [unclassified Providencia]|uniref:hypothetical protein n=1 Tax=unclassified Providencia TaxID=2633465 RepID=UPI002349821F|nr:MULTISPECIES: hypothetical protein [unclassified Providencia]
MRPADPIAPRLSHPPRITKAIILMTNYTGDAFTTKDWMPFYPTSADHPTVGYLPPLVALREIWGVNSMIDSREVRRTFILYPP